MAELVQERTDLAQCQQGGGGGGGFREVHDHRNVGAGIRSVRFSPLLLVVRHPCTALFSCARVEVAIEHREERTVCIQDFVCFNVGMVHRYGGLPAEADTVKALCEAEYALLYA